MLLGLVSLFDVGRTFHVNHIEIYRIQIKKTFVGVSIKEHEYVRFPKSFLWVCLDPTIDSFRYLVVRSDRISHFDVENTGFHVHQIGISLKKATFVVDIWILFLINFSPC